jgi:gluconolactonase
MKPRRLALITLLLAFTASAIGQSSPAKPSPAAPPTSIIRLDPRFDQLVPKDAKIEFLADDILWAEGPVWDKQGGFLLFSDTKSNTAYKWSPQDGKTVFLHPSGYTGSAPFTGSEPGSNGLTFDSQHRLTLCQHGDRRISRLEKDGKFTTLVDRYQGKRLNSPNDLVFKSNGDLYFTDPPYGLPKTFDDPTRELPFAGVFRLGKDGKVTLLTSENKAPNGIAFSPDEKTLYVDDTVRKLWTAYPVLADGTLGKGRILYDAAKLSQGLPGAPDGLKVDVHGNIWTAAPGGIFVIAPDGMLLGRFDLGAPTANCAWGDDGSTLYITSNHNLFRVRLNTKGARF